MTNASRDDNRVPALLATSSADGLSVVEVYANPTNNGLCVENGTSGSSYPSVDAQRDGNRVPALWATSSADGVTLIPVYADPSTKKILIKST